MSGLKIPPELQDDPEVRELLGRWNKMMEDNPLLRYNNPDLLPADKIHHKQLEFHAIKPPPGGVKALIAGNRSGKTVACVIDDIIQAIDEEAVPLHLRAFKKWQPPFKCWVGAPKFEKHEDTIIPFLRRYIPKDQLIEGNFDKSLRKQARQLILANGSEFGFKTYDQDKDSWASAEVHRIHWDEEPNINDSAALRYEAQQRLVSTSGEEIISMTPLLGWSWVKDEIWDRRHDPKISVVRMGMADNPWNPREMIEGLEKTLPEEEQRVRLHGEFVHFGGLVYPERKEHHTVNPPSPDHIKHQTIIESIDPGIRTTAVVFGAFDNDNSLLVFDELYLHGDDAIPENAAKKIMEVRKKWGVQPRYTVIDPSARNRVGTNADNIQAAYFRAGIRCYEAQNPVENGVMEVKRRFYFDLIGISHECEKLNWELDRYRIDPKSDGSFEVLKQDDHACDALRYLCMTRPIAPIQRKSKPKKNTDWVPGTAPAYDAPSRRPVSPLGIFA